MDTNGHATPTADPPSDIRLLREENEREELTLRKMELQQTRKVMEQWGGEYNGFVNPATPLFDSPDFFYPYIGENLPFNLDNRLKGELLPVYITEYGLKLLRDYSRWLAAFNPYAINALENRVSYIAGKGFGYSAVPVARVGSYRHGDLELCRLCQAVWDDFADRVDWGMWEQYLVRKVDVDGEAFLRFFHTGGGKVTIRPIEPEHVRSPGDQSAHRSFGIETPEYDIMDTLGFWVVLNPALSWTPTFVSAEDVIHIKETCTVGGPSSKRGYPLLIPVRQNLQRALNLLQYMSALARAQSSIAMTRKWKQYGAAAISAWQQNNADVQGQSWFSGQQRYGKQYGPATVLDIPENVEYEFPATKIGAAALVDVLQAELRAVASRLVMPEYMIGSNAENANYSSTLVAEAPSVKIFERIQASYARHFGDGRKGEPKHCGVWWRVIRAAVDWGRLPREVLTRVKSHVEPPMVAARDQEKETTRYSTLNEKGVLSKDTWSKKEGLERDREKAQIEKEQAEQQSAAPQGMPGQPGAQPPGAPEQPGPNQPPAPGGPGSGPQKPGQGIDEKRIPEMARDAREWIEEVFRSLGKKAPKLDDQDIADALRSQMPGEPRGMVEACTPNKAGHGYHDTETGAPCSPGGKETPAERPKASVSTGVRPGGDESPDLLPISEKAAKIIVAAPRGVMQQVTKVRDKVRAIAVKRFAAMEEKYGRAGAIAVMSAVIAMTPVPVPGSSLAPILIAEGVRYIVGRLSKPEGAQPPRDAAAATRDVVADMRLLGKKYGGMVPLWELRDRMDRRGVKNRDEQDRVINELRRKRIASGGSEEGRDLYRNPELARKIRAASIRDNDGGAPTDYLTFRPEHKQESFAWQVRRALKAVRVVQEVKDDTGHEHDPATGRFGNSSGSSGGSEGIHSRPSKGAATYAQAARDTIQHVGGIKSAADVRRAKSLLKRAGYKDEKLINDALMASGDKEKSAKPASPESLAKDVNDELLSLPSWTGNRLGKDASDFDKQGHKVFVADLFDRMKEKYSGLTMEDFKKQLVAAWRKGEIGLARADMGPEINPGKTKASETGYEGWRYHTVTLPKREKRAEESVSHPPRCGACGGPAIPMAAGGYRCGNPPCEWVRGERSVMETKDSQGHEHAPKGSETGGQFVKQGGGGGGRTNPDGPSRSQQTRPDKSNPYLADPKEHKATKRLAVAKIKSAPIPSPEKIAKMKAALERAKTDPKARAGGDARGSSADRRRRAQNLFREFGGEERGYVVCHGTGIRLHWSDDPKENPHGYPKFEQGKIFTACQGGGYQMPNLLPESFAYNRSRNDKPLRGENACK
jgi:Phage portal protein, lambda family